MKGNVPAVLFTEQGLPDVGVEALVVVRSRIWDLVRGERVMLRAVLEGELSGTGEHRQLQFLEDFSIEGVNLGKGRDASSFEPLINQGFGRGLYVTQEPR